jgi:hypothetical protein
MESDSYCPLILLLSGAQRATPDGLSNIIDMLVSTNGDGLLSVKQKTTVSSLFRGSSFERCKEASRRGGKEICEYKGDRGSALFEQYFCHS